MFAGETKDPKMKGSPQMVERELRKGHMAVCDTVVEGGGRGVGNGYCSREYNLKTPCPYPLSLC